ncbi:hypothetical protein [Billgrantia lactosivorans]|nr:hypothetical protein [Halomonas lactosivorans]
MAEITKFDFALLGKARMVFSSPLLYFFVPLLDLNLSLGFSLLPVSNSGT